LIDEREILADYINNYNDSDNVPLQRCNNLFWSIA